MRILDIVLPAEPGSATRRFFVASALWLAAGVTFGFLGALEMLAPDLLPHWAELSFGRVRPTHINLVVFGFLLNAYFGGLLHVVPTVCRTELYAERFANFGVWFYNLVVAGMLFTLPHGITQGREYAEAAWILDIGVLISLAALAIIVFGTIARRKEQLLYVSVWYIAAGLLWSFFVYAVGNVVWAGPIGSWQGI
ncbi:MAG: hypothetical protein C4523_14800, partial [Myxococcales bacterium]